jgi:hypothetical protein
MTGRPPGVATQALFPSPIRGFRKVAQGGALGYRALPFRVSPKGDKEDFRKIPVQAGDICRRTGLSTVQNNGWKGKRCNSAWNPE